MTTTTLRYNGKAFIYAPSTLVSNNHEGLRNLDVIEPQIGWVMNESGWSFNKRAELLNGRLAMLSFLTLIAVEDVLHQSIVRALGL